MTAIVDEFRRIPMSQRLAATLARAAEYAEAQLHRDVALEHLLLALTEDVDAGQVLAASHVDLSLLKADVSQYLGGLTLRGEVGPVETLAISADLRRILEAAAAAASQGRRRDIDGAIVLAAIVGDGKSSAAHMLRAQGLTFEEAIRALRRAMATPPAGPTPLEAAPVRPLSVVPPATPAAPRVVPLEPPVATEPAEPPRRLAAVTSLDAFRARPAAPPDATRYPGEPPPTVVPPGAGPPAQTGGPAEPRRTDDGEREPFLLPPRVRPELDPALTATPADRAPAVADDRGPAAPVATTPPPIPSVPPTPAPTAAPVAPTRARPAMAQPGSRWPGAAAPGSAGAAAPSDPRYAEAYAVPQPAAEPPAPQDRDVAPYAEAAPWPDAVHPPMPQAPPPLPPGRADGAPPPYRTGPVYTPAAQPPASPPEPPAPFPSAPFTPVPFTPATAPQVPANERPARSPDVAAPAAPASTAPSMAPAAAAPAATVMFADPPVERRRRRMPMDNAVARRLVEKVPRQFRVHEPREIEVRLSRVDAQALLEGLDGEANRYRVLVAPAMSMRLRGGDGDGAFLVDPASPETQWLESRAGATDMDSATWRWTVTPLRSGRGRLQLMVSARTGRTDGTFADTTLPDQVVDVVVALNLPRTALRIASWIVVAVAGGVVARVGAPVYQPVLDSLVALFR